jgi:2-polyprenyl-3-methyl-5-hydroxy-6-metoxy-1,4-benzoquinol methylase
MSLAKEQPCVSWHQYYALRINAAGGPVEYFEKKKGEKEQILAVVEAASRVGSRVLEVGCGTAIVSIALSKAGYTVVGVDTAQDLLGEISCGLNKLIGGHVVFVAGDCLSLCFEDRSFDLVLSHGLLEHYDNSQIVSIVREMLRVGKLVIISIPTSRFNNTTMIFGDERLLPARDWEKIINSTNCNVHRKFGFSYGTWLTMILGRVLPNFAFYFAPHIGFVLSSNDHA